MSKFKKLLAVALCLVMAAAMLIPALASSDVDVSRPADAKIAFNDEGKLIPREKVRGKKRVIQRIVQMMQAHAALGADYDGKVYISNSACREDAEAVAALIEEAFPKMNGKVQIFDIGTVIGSHTGPGTVALFFFGDKRTA